MSTSTFVRISRPAASRTSAATKSAASESPACHPAAASARPAMTASVPAMSLAKWRAFESSAGLP
jgi:hypothetical protein